MQRLAVMDKLESIKAVTIYINDLCNENFTGSLTLNFHDGNISSKIEIKKSEKL